MLIAFFSTGASAANAHAALLATHVVATLRSSATLVRSKAASGMSLAIRLPGHVRLVEVEPVLDDVASAMERALEHDGSSIIFDLPVGLFGEGSLRDRLDASVLTVGASPLDEIIAASMLAPTELPTSRPAPGSPAPWLLGCDRPDYASGSIQFERAMREAIPGRRDGCPGARFLPTVLPTPTPAEAASLLAGMPGEAALRRGHLLVAALMPVGGLPPEVTGRSVAPVGQSVPPGLIGREERLRDLADALDAMASGRAPSVETLADAQLLEDWSIEARAVPSLTGYTVGNADTGRGRWPVTVDIYATDGMSWARTYSRYYRLGRPAVASPAPQVR